MAAESLGMRRRAGVDWRRAEFVLTLLGVLGFITLPVRITTIYGGLPAHPLFVHVPVVLIPVTILAAIVCMIKPVWFSRYGIALAVMSIGAMSSIFLTMQAGGALQSALHLQGRAAHLISEHSQAAHYLALVYIAFTAIVIVTFAADRISGGMPTGLSVLDRALSPRGVFTALRMVLVLLCLAAAVMVFRVGDLGAKAVWQGRMHTSHALAGAVPALGAGVGPQACAAAFVHCVSLRHRSCRHAIIQPLKPSRLEIDVFGRRAPSCQRAVSQLRAAANRIGYGHSELVNGWHCRMTAMESCANVNAVLWGTNPGA